MIGVHVNYHYPYSNSTLIINDHTSYVSYLLRIHVVTLRAKNTGKISIVFEDLSINLVLFRTNE